MVQVLPAVPTFGQSLVETLANAGGQLAEGLQKRSAGQRLSGILSQIGGGAGAGGGQVLSPMQIAGIYEAATPVLGEQGAKILATQYGEQQKGQIKENIAINKENRELRDNVVDSYESAKVSESNIKRLEQLNDTATPLTAFLAEKTGIPLDLWASPDSEEFKKLVSQRGLNVAKSYGFGRILQTEFENFMKTLPSLLNTQEGRQRILHTLKYFDNISIQRYEQYKNLIQENNGKIPSDLKLELSKKMEPVYNKFGEILVYGDELVDVISPQGKKGKVPKNQLEEATNEGYTIPGAQ